METHKTCRGCGLTKSLEDYRRHPSYADGRDNKCKKCKSTAKPKSVLLKDCKKCSRCLEVKPFSDFSRDKATPTGYRSWCKACNALIRLAHASYGMGDRSKILLRKYGITSADYDAMLSTQGGECAICGTNVPGGNKSFFCVDHDHKTGAVRGLLCESCNRGIGILNDDPDILDKAASYLRTYT